MAAAEPPLRPDAGDAPRVPAQGAGKAAPKVTRWAAENASAEGASPGAAPQLEPAAVPVLPGAAAGDGGEGPGRNSSPSPAAPRPPAGPV